MDRILEILESISSNRTRTFLTGFSVAWGIFMLILLLGISNGMENGTREKFIAGTKN